jgi:hypothetical protein
MLQWANQIWLRLKALGKRNCRSGGGAAGGGVSDHAIDADRNQHQANRREDAHQHETKTRAGVRLQADVVVWATDRSVPMTLTAYGARCYPRRCAQTRFRNGHARHRAGCRHRLGGQPCAITSVSQPIVASLGARSHHHRVRCGSPARHGRACLLVPGATRHRNRAHLGVTPRLVRKPLTLAKPSGLQEPVHQDGLQRLAAKCTVENDFSRDAGDTSEAHFHNASKLR